MIQSQIVTGQAPRIGQTVDISGSIGVWDSITVSYPDTVTEVFTYSNSGISTVTITVVYVDSTKKEVSTVTKVTV